MRAPKIRKPRPEDVTAALAQGMIGALVAFVAIAAVACVAPSLIGSSEAAANGVMLAGCGVFVSRLTRKP